MEKNLSNEKYIISFDDFKEASQEQSKKNAKESSKENFKENFNMDSNIKKVAINSEKSSTTSLDSFEHLKPEDIKILTDGERAKVPKILKTVNDLEKAFKDCITRQWGSPTGQTSNFNGILFFRRER